MRRQQGGVVLLEALIAMAIMAFGLLGLIGLIARSYTAQYDAMERAAALVLMQDLAARMRNAGMHPLDTKGNAQANIDDFLKYNASYGAVPAWSVYPTDIQSLIATPNCASKSGIDRELCEFGKTLTGADTTASLTPLKNPQACVRSITQYKDYLVVIAWTGRVNTAAPTVSCNGLQNMNQANTRAVWTRVSLS